MKLIILLAVVAFVSAGVTPLNKPTETTTDVQTKPNGSKDDTPVAVGGAAAVAESEGAVEAKDEEFEINENGERVKRTSSGSGGGCSNCNSCNNNGCRRSLFYRYVRFWRRMGYYCSPWSWSQGRGGANYYYYY